MKKLPSFQFYPGDWRKDPNLQRCTHAAKGVLMEIMCLMFENQERGYLATSGVAWSDSDVAQAVGGDKSIVLACITELSEKGVLRRDNRGALYNSRLVRDEHKRALCSEAGKKGGGNPRLKSNIRHTFKGSLKGEPKGHDKGGLKQIPNPSSSSSLDFSYEKSSNDESQPKKPRSLTPRLETFCRIYRERFGREYIVGDYGKASKQAKDTEKTVVDDREYEKSLISFFADGADFVVNSGHSLSAFISRINAYVTRNLTALSTPSKAGVVRLEDCVGGHLWKK